jgi:hypothetical protein
MEKEVTDPAQGYFLPLNIELHKGFDNFQSGESVSCTA